MSDILYNRIGNNYNQTRRADPFLTERLHALLNPDKTGIYLDVGCGTGNYTLALTDYELTLYGLDPSETMLQVAKSRAPQINWTTGFVEDIPFGDAFFNGATAVLTLHHWKNPEAGCRELFRVLKPGSSLVFFTATPEQMEGYWLNRYFPEMLKRSTGQMPSLERLHTACEAAGFTIAQTEKYVIQDDLQDLFLHAGKYKPEMYLDETIRSGISSFANLGLADEVSRGLAELAQDIASGKITEIIQRYENTSGDYLFVSYVK